MIKKITFLFFFTCLTFFYLPSQAQLVFKTDMEILGVDCTAQDCVSAPFTIKDYLFIQSYPYCANEGCTVKAYRGVIGKSKYEVRDHYILKSKEYSLKYAQTHNIDHYLSGYQDCQETSIEDLMCYTTTHYDYINSLGEHIVEDKKGGNFGIPLLARPRTCSGGDVNYVPGLGCLVPSSTSDPGSTKRPIATAPSYCKQCPTGDAALAENNTNPLIDSSVEAATGAKIDNEEDISYPIPFSRNYSSQRLEYGSLGGNWRHNYERKLSIYYSDLSLSTALTLTFDAPNNEKLIFLRNSATEAFRPFFKDNTGYTVSMVGNQYVLNAPNGSKEYYLANMVNGKASLVKTEDSKGYTYNYAYNALEQLISITDSYGRYLNFVYSDYANVITQVNASNGDSVSYTYLDGYVVEAKFNNTETQGYSYLNGNLISKTDPKGNIYEFYTYDNKNRVIESKHTAATGVYNGVYQYTYNASKTTVIMPDGATTVYNLTSILSQPKVSSTNIAGSLKTNSITYDTNGNSLNYNDGISTAGLNYDLATNLLSTSTYRGISRTYSWDTATRLVSGYTETTSAFSRNYSFLYDTNRNMTQKTINSSGQNRTWNYTYSTFGKITSSAEPTGAITTINYYSDLDANLNARGLPNTITNAAGHITTINSYDNKGNPTSITYPNNITKTMSYDLRGRLLSETQLGITNNYVYDAAGQMTQASLANGYVLNMAYDMDHRLTAISDNRGNNVVYTLDTNGNITNENEYRNSVLVSTKNKIYDSVSRMTQLSRAGNAYPYLYGYDKKDRLTSVKNPDNENQTLSYDTQDNLLGKSGLGRNENATRDADGNLTKLTQVGVPTSFTYNGFGEILTMTNPDTGNHSYNNNVSGKTFTQTDNAGVVHTTNYDNLGRPLNITRNAQYESFTWDTVKLGKLSTISDGSGTTSYNYDTNVRLSSKTQATGASSKTVNYAYDSSGQVNKITYPSGMEINYQYNNGEISGIQVSSTTLLNQINYKGFSSVPTTWVWGNSNSRNFAIDASDRLTSLLDSTALNQTFSQDNTGNITGITDIVNNNNSFTATYSVSDQLLTFNHVLGNKTLGQDGKFNLQSIAPFDSTTSRVYYGLPVNTGSGNRITTITYTRTPTAYAYPTYDLKGNMITDGKGATFSYDNSNNLVGYINAAGSAAYAYNSLHQRVSKTVLVGGIPTTTYFVYNESGLLLGEYDTSGNPIAEHIYLGSLPVGVVKGGNIYYVHTDHLGTPRAVSNQSGTIMWKWDNANPYGYNSANETVSGTPFEYNVRFPGQYYDKESGLHYNYNRHYSPELGRYMQPDPIGISGGLNSYAYVENNPLGASDPYGLWVQYAVGAGVGGVSNGLGNGLNYYSQGCSFWKGFKNGFIGGAVGGAIFVNQPTIGAASGSALTQALNRGDGVQSFSNAFKDIGWSAITGGLTGWAGGAAGLVAAQRSGAPLLGPLLGNINAFTYGNHLNNWSNVGTIIEGKGPPLECQCKNN